MSLLTTLLKVTALVPLWTFPPPAARVAVLSIDLNDVSNQPVPPELRVRLGLLTDALRTRLATACGYLVAPPPRQPGQGNKPGYYYAHPDVAVAETGPEQADWLIIPRLNRASPWVSDLQAHVVRVRDTTIVSNRIVEIKGLELTPELASRLVDRGAAWMADQVSQSIETAAGAETAARRRCRA